MIKWLNLAGDIGLFTLKGQTLICDVCIRKPCDDNILDYSDLSLSLFRSLSLSLFVSLSIYLSVSLSLSIVILVSASTQPGPNEVWRSAMATRSHLSLTLSLVHKAMNNLLCMNKGLESITVS